MSGNSFQSYYLSGAVILFAIFFILTIWSCRVEKEFDAPQILRCEYRKDPLGLDVQKPRLSWYVTDTRRGAKQSAYQIIVASNENILEKNEGNIWDSGKIPSDLSVHVIYDGPQLESQKKYYWKWKYRGMFLCGKYLRQKISQELLNIFAKKRQMKK